MSSFGSSLVSSFQSGLPSFGAPTEQRQQTVQGIIAQENLQAQVSNVPETPIETPLTDLQKGRLTFAGFLESEGLAGNIDLQTGIFRNQFTTQPLDFTIGSGGVIKTGTVGLAPSTLAAQQQLSERYGIPTFDINGNLSTFGGLSASLSR